MNTKRQIRAYAIFDGGGVKGAALAGALEAAQQTGFSFVGFGGTSAGSIVALLAAVGYSGEQLSTILTEELKLPQLLDETDQSLHSLALLTSLGDGFRSKNLFGQAKAVWRCRHVLQKLRRNLGLYAAANFEKFLLEKIKKQIPEYANKDVITFGDLESHGCPRLRIIASDLRLRSPVIYDAVDHKGTSVTDAVRASMSYPFVFTPVPINKSRLVDGGLSSNLPVFLFREERRKTNFPVLAFDLVAKREPPGEEYGFREFCGDLLATALESSEHLLQQSVDGVYSIPIVIPSDIDTLSFSLPASQLESLRLLGYHATNKYLNQHLPQLFQTENTIEQMQALYLPPQQVTPILRAVAHEFERETRAKAVRAHLMLPTGRGTLTIVYEYGMDNDADSGMELRDNAGCAGRVWQQRKPLAIDLAEAGQDATSWGLSRSQQALVRSDRRAVFSTPVFYIGKTAPESGLVDDLDLFGVLSIDTASTLEETGWIADRKEVTLKTGRLWADILSHLLV